MGRQNKGSGCVYQPKYKTKDGQEREGSWRRRFVYTDKLGAKHVVDKLCEGPEMNKTKARALLTQDMNAAINGRLVTGMVKDLDYAAMRTLLLSHYEENNCKSLLTAKDRKTHYLSSLSHLDNFFGTSEAHPTVKALAIDPLLIDEFRAKRREQGASNASINRSLQLLRQMFSVATEKVKFPEDRVPRIKMLKEPPPRQGFVEFDEFKRLRQALPEYLRVPTTLAYFTGMRLSEVVNLRWDYVNLKKRMIFLPPGYAKNGEPRMIPLIGELPDMLGILRQQNPDADQVFTREGVPLQTFRKAWNRACVTAGLGYMKPVLERATGQPVLSGKRPKTKYCGRTFHDLRRSAVSNLVQSGVDPVTATLISGHKTMEVFKRYRIAVERHLIEAGSKVGNYLDSISQTQVKEIGIQAPREVKLLPN
jgi:integrase